LMDRPRRGNRNSSWKPEVQPKAQTWDDLPDDVQVRLREVKCDLDLALAKKHGKTKVRVPSTRTASKTSKGAPMPTILDAPLDAPWCQSFQKPRNASMQSVSSLLTADSLRNASKQSVSSLTADGGFERQITPSNASTASGDEMEDPCHEISCSTLDSDNTEAAFHEVSLSTPDGDEIEAPSDEVSCSTLDMAESRATDSENGSAVFHIVNNPKAKHALLRTAKGDKVASSRQSLALPLGLRRVMCAVLPSGAGSSLQLSGNQMHKLRALQEQLQAQKW